MSITAWLQENTDILVGRCVAISGATGGLGREICFYLSQLGAKIILLDRNAEKSAALEREIKSRKSDTDTERITLDLEHIENVKAVADTLCKNPPDILILNAGAYSIPRHKCDTGYDNVFQINFLSPYYLARRLLPFIEKKGGKIIAVGSIAHNYSKTDITDIDFKGRKKSSLVYGNAKRYLMFSLLGLKSNAITIAHPGITFTNITNHYPKLIFAIIKHPMKIIFMKPKKACLSVIYGIFKTTDLTNG